MVQWPRLQRLARRKALREYRISELPAPLRENAALRQVAARHARRDARLLEAHVHEAEWPLKLPITALAGAGDVRGAARSFLFVVLEGRRGVAADSPRRGPWRLKTASRVAAASP